MSDTSEEDSIGIYVGSTGGGSTDKVVIQLPWHKSLSLINPLFFNWVDDNSVDIIINVTILSEICFNANGGTFKDTGGSLYFKNIQDG